MNKITIDSAMLEQAIEALEASKGLVIGARRNMALQGNAVAMASLPQLELAEQRHLEAIAALRKALAQPQQEPVAWAELLREARDNCRASIVEEGISAGRKEYRIDLEARLTAAVNGPPPERKPLTDEQWMSVGRQARDAFFGSKQDGVLSQIDCAAHAAMRATESANGIKDTPC